MATSRTATERIRDFAAPRLRAAVPSPGADSFQRFDGSDMGRTEAGMSLPTASTLHVECYLPRTTHSRPDVSCSIDSVAVTGLPATRTVRLRRAFLKWKIHRAVGMPRSQASRPAISG